MNNNEKRWWQSKTNWIAILQFSIGIAVLVGNTFPNWVGFTVIIKSILDGVLRGITTQPISTISK
jgi:hypothetical protein